MTRLPDTVPAYLTLIAWSATAFATAIAWSGEIKVVDRAEPPADIQYVRAANLSEQSTGVVFAEELDEPLPPGRYRLRALASLSPFGDVVNSTVVVELAVDQQRKRYNSLQFAVADAWEPLTLEFKLTKTTRKLPVSIGWNMTIQQASVARRKALASKEIHSDEPKQPKNDLVDDLISFDGSGRMTLAAARRISHRLLLARVEIERLSPISIERVRTQRVIYRPGEPGAAHVVLKNYGARSERVDVTAVLEGGLTFSQPVAQTELSIAAGETAQWSVPFPTAGRRWGHRLQVTAKTDDGRTSSAHDTFSITDRPWEVALLGVCPTQGHISGVDSPAIADQLIDRLRERGFNGFEAYFWAPCDMLDFTPDEELFFSGQTSYPSTRKSVRNLIAAAHRQGMVATVYSNLWGGDGPPVFEILRRHPDWFGPTSFGAKVLDHWDLFGNGRGEMGSKQLPAPIGSVWCYASVAEDPSDGVFRLHAQELIDSHREFGWDGIRYDSNYSSDWTVRAMDIVRSTVQREVPNYMFGYNAFTPHEQAMGALDVLVGGPGGGMQMAEGLRMERQSHYAPWADGALQWRDACWPYDGHLGPLYTAGDGGQSTMPSFQKKSNDNTRPPTWLDAVNFSSLFLAVGAHPYYQNLESAVGEHQEFGKRYSEFVYDNHMRPLQDPGQVIQFGEGVNFFRWKPLARTVTLAGTRRRLVVHLINADEQGEVSTNLALKRPPLKRNLPVTLRLPPHAKVHGAWALRAVPAARHVELPVEQQGEATRIVVDEVRFWTVLVVDYDSSTPLAEPVSLKDKSDSQLQRWYVAGPFPNVGPEQAGFDTVYPPERTPAAVDLLAQYYYEDKTITWKPTFNGDTPAVSHKLVDLREHFGRLDEACAYAYTTISMDRAQQAVLIASANDTLTVWLNGQQVFAKKAEQPHTPLDMYQIPVEFAAGENKLLLKVCQRKTNWAFRLRLAQPDGALLTAGVKYLTRTAGQP